MIDIGLKILGGILGVLFGLSALLLYDKEQGAEVAIAASAAAATFTRMFWQFATILKSKAQDDQRMINAGVLSAMGTIFFVLCLACNRIRLDCVGLALIQRYERYEYTTWTIAVVFTSLAIFMFVYEILLQLGRRVILKLTTSLSRGRNEKNADDSTSEAELSSAS